MSVLQAQRTKRLEAITEQMSTCFIRCADELLAHEVVRGCEDLVCTLQGAMAEILELAKEVVGDSGAAEEETPESEHSVSSSKLAIETPPDITTSLLDPSPVNPVTSETLLEPPNRLNASFIDSLLAIDPRLLFPPKASSAFFHQVPGNEGYPHDLPLLYEPYYGKTDLDYFAADGFIHRLVRASVTQGYITLKNASDSPHPYTKAYRKFNLALQLYPKAHILQKLRQTLDSEQKHFSKLYDIRFQDLPDELLAAAVVTTGAERDGAPLWSKFMNAREVYLQLQAVGGRMIDSDIMELRLRTPDDEFPINVHRRNASAQQAQNWGYLGFFPTPQRKAARGEAAGLTVQLSVSMLVANLSHVSICLVPGPGYPRHELGHAVEAAVTMVNGVGIGSSVKAF